jgi:isochorismate pyruvate lyase
MTSTPDPEQSTTMADVRAGIDAVDREVVRLLARRFAFMDSAARIKPERAQVRDEARKAEVLSNVAAEALVHRIDPALVRGLYEQLIEASIAYELEAWNRLRA